MFWQKAMVSEQLLLSLYRTEWTFCVHPWSQGCQTGGHHTPCSRRAKQPPKNPNQSIKVWKAFNPLWIVKRSWIISIKEKNRKQLGINLVGFVPSVVSCKLLADLFKKYSLAATLYSNSLHLFFGLVRKKQKNIPGLQFLFQSCFFILALLLFVLEEAS